MRMGASGVSTMQLCTVLFSLLQLSLVARCTAAGNAQEGEVVNGLRCAVPEECQTHDPLLVYHVVIGAAHEEAEAFFTHHICRAKMLCVSPANMRFVLHSREEWTKPLARLMHLAKSHGIAPHIWIGEYSSTTMMEHRFMALGDKVDGNSFIVHADTDEFMSVESIKQGYRRMKKDKCDYVVGTMVDRVSQDGSLNTVTMSRSLEEQFPLRCHITDAIAKGSDTKVTIYRANYRPTRGGHQMLTCKSKRASECKREIKANFHKYTFGAKSRLFTLSPFAHMDRWVPPRKCNIKDDEVSHYKFTKGLVDYLHYRVEIEKSMGYHFWKESERLLDSLKANDNKFCVDCKELKCH